MFIITIRFINNYLIIHLFVFLFENFFLLINPKVAIFYTTKKTTERVFLEHKIQFFHRDILILPFQQHLISTIYLTA